MYEQIGCSFVQNDHDLGFTETAQNLTTNNFSQIFSVDQDQSLSMAQELPYNNSLLLIHNSNPNHHVQDPLNFFGTVPEATSRPTAPSFMELFGPYRSNYSVASATSNNNGCVASSFFGSDIGIIGEGLNIEGGVLYDYHQNIGDDYKYRNVQFEDDNNDNINGVLLDFTMENLGGCFGRGLLNNGGINIRPNPFATERQRRMQMSGKYAALRDLIPNPTKMDRASVVGDAIEYIKELTRTVQELKLLVERKRYSTTTRSHQHHHHHHHHHQDDHMMIRIKKHKTDHHKQPGEETPAARASIAAMDGSDNMKQPSAKLCDRDDHHDHNDRSNGRLSLRSSWLRRKSNDTEVDVRIVDDEVTVKLIQRKKINLLLFASKLLHQLRLDIRHIAGGCVGDSYSFLLNTKICEGSSLYASAIANKLIECLDRQYATISL